MSKWSNIFPRFFGPGPWWWSDRLLATVFSPPQRLSRKKSQKNPQPLLLRTTDNISETGIFVIIVEGKIAFPATNSHNIIFFFVSDVNLLCVIKLCSVQLVSWLKLESLCLCLLSQVWRMVMSHEAVQKWCHIFFSSSFFRKSQGSALSQIVS